MGQGQTRNEVRIEFEGAAYSCGGGETVLDALNRQGAGIAFSCRKGTCLTCIVKAAKGPVPTEAQKNLRPALTEQGYFLACQCRPSADMSIAPAIDAALFGRARVVAVEPLAERVCRLRLEPATPLYYRAGQFINLKRADGLQRSYSLASVPSLDAHLELHVKRLDGGRMSNWIFDQLKPGDGIDFQGPNGDCFYLPPKSPEQSDQGMILIGTGTGLAPLIGIVRDALNSGHSGPMRLYHGSRRAGGLYLTDELGALAGRAPNFSYIPCLSGGGGPECRASRADAAAFADQPDLSGWRVYLCGDPEMVGAARKTAFLAGAQLADIFADPFDLADLRARPRQEDNEKPEQG